MTFIDRVIANRARKSLSDAGRSLGAARIAKERANRDTAIARLRACVDSGRIANLGWRA